ncbi:MAG: hypothetical protein KIT16_01075 [Rhodospirillaceae bacterium]|nr:hypothetical protein [Rhodospirillaceae bacterium]
MKAVLRPLPALATLPVISPDAIAREPPVTRSRSEAAGATPGRSETRTQGMRNVGLRSAFAALVLALSSAAFGQTPPSGYAPLAFDPDAGMWAFRIDGVATVCVKDGACKPLTFRGIADDKAAAATVVALGRADRAFYLSVQNPDIEKGEQRLFRCTVDGCRALSTDGADFVALGAVDIRRRDRATRRVAVLANPADPAGTSRLLLCDDDGCVEQAVTRDNRYRLFYLGRSLQDGRNRIWLRDKGGAVLACFQDVEGESTSLTCRPSDLAFPAAPDLAGGSDLDQASLVKAFEAALARGNFAEADRLLAEGLVRFPGQAMWAQLQSRLAQRRAAHDRQLRIQQAQRLVAEARRVAHAGDFAAADAMLREAAGLAPGLGEIASARTEIARLKAIRDARLRDRRQYVDAIEAALAGYELWDAENLIGEAERRFPGDQAIRGYRQRLAQIRARAEWQGRLRRARAHIAAARRAMALGDFDDAERQLKSAHGLTPGLPEIGAARADLARLRIEAEWQRDEIQQLTAAIERAIRRDRFGVAERLLTDGKRRYPRHSGWSALERRLDQAKRADRGDKAREERVRALLANARAAIGRKDYAAADRALDEAEKLDPKDEEVKKARAELQKAQRDAQQDQARTQRIKALLAAARAAIGRKDYGAADRALDQAEKLDPKDEEVKKARAELAAAIKGSVAPHHDQAHLKATFHRLIMAQASRLQTHERNRPPMSMLEAYRQAQGNRALAYCVDWSKVRADMVPPGPAGMHAAADPRAAAGRALAECRRGDRGQPCECTLVDVNGRNVLTVPQEVVDRLNKSP